MKKYTNPELYLLNLSYGDNICVSAKSTEGTIPGDNQPNENDKVEGDIV